MAKKAEVQKAMSKAACIREVLASGLAKGVTQEEIAKLANEKFQRTDIKQGDVANAVQGLKNKADQKKTAKTAKGVKVKVKRATGKQMEFPPAETEMSLDELVQKFGTISNARAVLEATLAKLQ